MRHVKFDGSGFIGFGNFASFVAGFFLYGQCILVQIIISIIIRYHWCLFNIFHMIIISSEDSIPQCEFKPAEICDVIE